ncbi:hypothetical protein [Mycolicibacterium palauense]|uniref:hypothetical protein n=1 Tax=Mycolicibacterium palauense TaxID=2034511 RepID=UPI000BFEB5B3|nr:hypothetical protein [Mycolicibacterium palauense]
MKWINVSDENPGFSAYYAKPDDNRLYVIRRKKPTETYKSVIWRLFTRSGGEPLRVIYTSQTLKQAKAFADELEKAREGESA